MTCNPRAVNIIPVGGYIDGPDTYEAIFRAVVGTNPISRILVDAVEIDSPESLVFANTSAVRINEIRVGEQYVLGGPQPAGLRGNPTPHVLVSAFQQFMERYGLRQSIPQETGDPVTITLQGLTEALVGIQVAVVRDPVLQTLVRPTPTRLLAASATIPAGATETQIEIAGTSRGGRLIGWGLSAVSPNKAYVLAQAVRVGLATSRTTLMEPIPVEMWRLMVAEGRAFPFEIATEPGEPLYLVVTNADEDLVSFVCEWEYPGGVPQPWTASTAKPTTVKPGSTFETAPPPISVPAPAPPHLPGTPAEQY